MSPQADPISTLQLEHGTKMLAKSLTLPAFRASLALLAIALSTGQSAQASTLITISTSMGDIKVDLFNDIVPGTAQNILNLTDAGRYTNTLIHRSLTNDFMIQGGGFTANYAAIPNNGEIPLHYKIKNTRGTIAMARTADPNSATSQWFISTVDNSTTLGPGGPGASSADGYAAFGWVVSGMDIVDAIEDLPIFNMANRTGNGALTEMPLQNYTQANYLANVPITDANKVIVNGISRVEDHPSFQNPIWDVDVNNSGNLSTSDVMSIVNSILTHGRRHSADASRITDTYKYFDTNGDNFVSTSDLMRVVNAILRGDTAPASPLAAMADPMAAPLAVVPEPSSLLLGVFGSLGLAALALRRRQFSRRTTAKSA